MERTTPAAGPRCGTPRARRGAPAHMFFYSRVDNDPLYKDSTIVPLSSSVLIRSLRFTPQWSEDVASTHQWRVDVCIGNYRRAGRGGFVRGNCNYGEQTLFKDFGARVGAIRNHIYDIFCCLNESRRTELPPRTLVRFMRSSNERNCNVLKKFIGRYLRPACNIGPRFARPARP